MMGVVAKPSPKAHHVKVEFDLLDTLDHPQRDQGLIVNIKKYFH